MNKFEKLGIDKNTLKNIEKLGYESPTEIQEKTIPLIIEGKDVIAQSATGTGKTLAFLSGIINKIDDYSKLQALIITPTRELAIQIFKEAEILSNNSKIKYCVVYGGDSIGKQAMNLKHANIVVATPGRLLDHIQRKNINLNKIKFIVLDEADRMVDMGFITDIKKILKGTPKEKQILLFSATITKDVSNIEKKYMSNAKRVSAEYHVDNKKLLQEYYKIHENKKLSLLVYLLLDNKKSLVFCNTRSLVDIVEYNLKLNNIEAYKLHGGLEQRKRTHIISSYLKNKSATLVATDVASRGIHVNDIQHIYNFDLPKEKIQYVHRIGRTARAGKDGKAISFVSPKYLNNFLKMCKKYKFDTKLIHLPDFKYLDLKKPIRKRSGTSYSSKKRTQFNRKINDLKKGIATSRIKESSRESNKQEYLDKKNKKFRSKQRIDRQKYKKKLKSKKYIHRN